MFTITIALAITQPRKELADLLKNIREVPLGKVKIVDWRIPNLGYHPVKLPKKTIEQNRISKVDFYVDGIKK